MQEVVDLTGAYNPSPVNHYVLIVCFIGDVDMETAIPSSSAINAAKEKRDRLRKVGKPEEDFISLSLTKRQDYSQGPHPESRLVREDDEMGEGDDGELLFAVSSDANWSANWLRRICGVH